MSTSSRIASMPAATWASSRSSGPRTAATMQNSVAPVLAVCLAASTRLGMSSQALRTGEANRPGLRAEVTVLGAAAGLEADDALDLDLRSAPAHPDLVGQRQQLVEPIVGQPQHGEHLVLVEALAPLQHLLTGSARMSVTRMLLTSELNGVQVRVMACGGTNATWSTRRPRSWTRYGIADLTMRRLARELDVTPGALYWHFANKQQLLGRRRRPDPAAGVQRRASTRRLAPAHQRDLHRAA